MCGCDSRGRKSAVILINRMLPFSLNVPNSPELYHVTRNLYNLLSIVLGKDFDFPQLLHMFSLAETLSEPHELLREAEILKDMSQHHTRPYIDVGRPLDQHELEGMLHFPELLNPEGQIVQDWSEFVEIEGEMTLAAHPPTLVAADGRLHLINAIAPQVAVAKDWPAMESITAETFTWSDGRLLTDGLICLDAPDHFRRPGGNYKTVSFTMVPVYAVWGPEIEELIRACRDAIRLGEMVRTMM